MPKKLTAFHSQIDIKEFYIEENSKMEKTNGLGQAGYRKPSYGYSDNPTFIDFEMECPKNCSSLSSCTLYTMWESWKNKINLRKIRE